MGETVQPIAAERGPILSALMPIALAIGSIIVLALLTGSGAPARASDEPASVWTQVEQPPHVVRAITATVFLPLVVSPSPPPPSNMWHAEYYANTNLDGTPARTADELRVDYDWGGSAPSGLPANYFSARWTGDWHFEVGSYTFFVFADDGVRLWLDGNLLIDAWQPGWGEYEAPVLVNVDGGHEVKLEYFEEMGDAAVRIHWRRTDLYPQWRGEYFREPWVESGKVYEQTDTVVQFDWGDGCPDGVPCDGFSVRWQATPVFEPGTHRIYLYADDGYQLYVDGSKVSEGGWYEGQSGGADDVVHTLEISALEQHQVTYNFHDRGSLAEARLWIECVERPHWTAEYYTNMSLSGDAEIVREEEAVFYDWGFEAPRPQMPSADQFSVRWTGQRYFHSGFYRFGLFADDGVRLYVDGELLVDQWHPGRGEYHSLATYLETGYHEVIVEYYEDSGEAEIRLWWE